MPKWTKRANKPLNNLWNSKEQRCCTAAGRAGLAGLAVPAWILDTNMTLEGAGGLTHGARPATFLSISCTLIEIKCMSKRQLVFARATLDSCSAFGGGTDWIKALHHFSWPLFSIYFLAKVLLSAGPFSLIIWKFGSNCQQQLALTLFSGP